MGGAWEGGARRDKRCEKEVGSKTREESYAH